MTTTIFNQDELTKALQATLSTVPDGHTNAVVASVDPFGVQVAASFSRPGPGTSEWTFQAAAAHQWTGNNSVGGHVILSW